MSLGVVVKGSEGVVLAADTRVTIEFRRIDDPADHHRVNFDNATKILKFQGHEYVGVVTYGNALIGQRTMHSFIPEIELELGEERLSIRCYAKKLSDFFLRQWKKLNDPSREGMTFMVGGYDEGKPYGSVYLFEIPKSPDPSPRSEDQFGITWGGQLEIADRVIQGYDPKLIPILASRFDLSPTDVQDLVGTLRTHLAHRIPYDMLPLQDCVNLATFLIRTTIDAQKLSVGVRGVGGIIEVAAVTRTDGLKWIQKKELRGENHND